MGLVRAVAAVDESASRDEVTQAIADLAAITRWCDGREVALAGFMAEHSPIPEKPIAEGAGDRTKKAKRALKRNETAKETPKLGEGARAGQGLGRAPRRGRRGVGAVSSADKRKSSRSASTRIAGDGRGDERGGVRAHDPGRAATHWTTTRATSGLKRQQRAIRFNHRVDPATGMIEFWGKLDPLRGMKFLNQLKDRVGRAVRRQDARRLPVRPDREERLSAGARSARPVRRARPAKRSTRGHRRRRHPRHATATRGRTSTGASRSSSRSGC